MTPGLQVIRWSRLPVGRPWVPTALLSGLVLAGVWTLWPAGTLGARLLRDAILFLAAPIGLVLLAQRGQLRERLGWQFDRRAVRTAVGLTALVLPIYVVGASLPSVRAAYPMATASVGASQVVPRAALVIGLVVATETFYRGLLCVGIREVGPVAILVSPVLYALQHLGGVPIEILLAAPADVLFGAADYRSQSIVPSILAHVTGLLVLEWLVVRPPLLSPERVGDLLGWLPIPV